MIVVAARSKARITMNRCTDSIVGFVSCSMYGNIIELFGATVSCVSGYLVLGQATVQVGYQCLKASCYQNQLCHEKRQSLCRYACRRKLGRRIRKTGRWYSSNTPFVVIITIIVIMIKLVHSTRKIRVHFCVGSRTHIRFIGIYCGHYSYCTRVAGCRAPSCRLAMTWIARTDIL